MPIGNAFTFCKCVKPEKAAKDAKNSLPHFENCTDFLIFVEPLRKIYPCADP
jgi:hypothetical protein